MRKRRSWTCPLSRIASMWEACSLGCNAVLMCVSPHTLTHAQPRRVPIGCQPSANLGGPRP